MAKEGKTPFFKRKWVWAVIALIVIFAAIPSTDKDESENKSQDQPNVEDVKSPESEKSIPVS